MTVPNMIKLVKLENDPEKIILHVCLNPPFGEKFFERNIQCFRYLVKVV